MVCPWGIGDDGTVRTEGLSVASMGRSVSGIGVEGVLVRSAVGEWLLAELHVAESVVVGGDRSSILVIPLVGGVESGTFVSGGSGGLGMISCFLLDSLGEGVETLDFLLAGFDRVDLVILVMYNGRLSCCCGSPVWMDME